MDGLHDCISANFTLFGHNARIWDCDISNSIVITAGEDCTCRAWGIDGKQLVTLKEHIGRGIWRCLYDSTSSLLITAGFDSAIKVHRLTLSLNPDTKEQNAILDDLKDQKESFTICAPEVTKDLSMMDSRSEYVRCIHFTRENILYVATNNGYLYHTDISCFWDVKWTKLIQVSKEAPTICMDILSLNSSMFVMGLEEIVALGDGKGNVTLVKLIYDGHTPKIFLVLSWPAEKERQLLGVHWSNSLGCQHLFTSDPKGTLKLWKIRNNLQFDAQETNSDVKVSLIAQFTSVVGQRIVCIDTSIKEEVLICGDKRGNITVFSLSEGLLNGSHVELVKMSPLYFFKGSHGISSVNSIHISHSYFDHVEICTTGGDGCICYFKYYRSMQKLEFIGMKQVKVISTIQCLSSHSNPMDAAKGRYAIGFTSVDFIILDLTNETKTVQVPCGGWRRPYSYYLGNIPQYQHCFAYIKDYAIHVHRLWLLATENCFPRTLHIQYHGREIHTISSIYFGFESEFQKSCHSWIATGCEDGSVRLTRYSPFEKTKWSESNLLGEHVGGSAVRSICFVAKPNNFRCENFSYSGNYTYEHADDSENDLSLLISVGSKRVLTSWVLRHSMHQNTEEVSVQSNKGSKESSGPLRSQFSPLSFQWLSTYVPIKFSRKQRQQIGMPIESSEVLRSTMESDLIPRSKPQSTFLDYNENDWRYMAVTAFLLKHTDSRLTVCFIVVACSDTTLVLRALLLPCRLWFDIAVLVPTNSPVLSLQHIVISRSSLSKDIAKTGDVYIVISGSTDGSITFWDLTNSVEYFMQLVLDVPPHMFIDSNSRPQTGRGSQGGRWWKSLPSQNNSGISLTGNEGSNENITISNGKCTTENITMASSMQVNGETSHPPNAKSMTGQAWQGLSEIIPLEVHEIKPLYVLNSVHQSGVNCLHVSELKQHPHSKSERYYCVLSGGDDQSLHYLGFNLAFESASANSYCTEAAGTANSFASGNVGKLGVLFRSKVPSSHSSAVKGVWTDGLWVFSVGLDQRIRCWKVTSSGEITEQSHLIVSVPEPEGLSAILCDSSNNIYQIAVAGRGMQIVTFDASSYHK